MNKKLVELLEKEWKWKGKENHFKENSVVYDVETGELLLVLDLIEDKGEWLYKLLRTNGEFTYRDESSLTSGLTEKQLKKLLAKSYLKDDEAADDLPLVYDVRTGEAFLATKRINNINDKFSYYLLCTNGKFTRLSGSWLTLGLNEKERKKLLIKSYLKRDEIEIIIHEPAYKKGQIVWDGLTKEKLFILGFKLVKGNYSYLLIRSNGKLAFLTERSIASSLLDTLFFRNFTKKI